MLQCPVRACQLALTRDGRRLHCPSGHSFDAARSGYVNLLQPQERRSKNPGDSSEAVAARRRLHSRGVTEPLLRAIADLFAPQANDAILDAGCGEGFYLGSMQSEYGFQGSGIDISVPAIDAAARRYPECEWIVANADRSIPYRAQSFSKVMSITARMNPDEFHRVLKEDGRLLVAIPAPEDLIELRGGVGRDRVARTAETFATKFNLLAHRRAAATADLDMAEVEDVLLSIYRPMQPVAAQARRVTLAIDMLLFGRRT